MDTIRFVYISGEPWSDLGLCTQRRAQFECFQRALLRVLRSVKLGRCSRSRVGASRTSDWSWRRADSVSLLALLVAIAGAGGRPLCPSDAAATTFAFAPHTRSARLLAGDQSASHTQVQHSRPHLTTARSPLSTRIALG